jgi:serine protease Do
MNEHENTTTRTSRLLAGAALALALSAGVVHPSLEANAQDPAPNTGDAYGAPAPTVTRKPLPPRAAVAPSGLPDVASVFERQRDKVVSVTTEMAPSRAQVFMGSRAPRVGQGSGFVVDVQGFIVTNYHVVAGAQKIEVVLKRGAERYPARLIGADEKTDIALIKIAPPPGGLEAVSFGSSGSTRVGEWVVAIGNPFGLDHSVTAGIVSAKGRNLGQGPYDDFLQTDASINPGNSGGPLFNLAGEVVGVNTAIIRDGQGIGFAVPIDLVKTLLPQLRERGYVVRGFIGADLQRLSSDLADSFGLERDHGVLLGSVLRGGPAARAGLERGDVVTHFNARRVRSVQELLYAVAEAKPKDRVVVSFVRDGKTRKVTLEVAERPDSKRARLDQKEVDPDVEARGRDLGLELEALDARSARRMGLARTGAYVADVAPDSPASGALEPGDVIIQLGRDETPDPDAFRGALGKLADAEVVRMLVWRDGRSMFVAVRR